MRHIVAVCNQKGGVGKTTTTYHLARAAIRRGMRVLLVDLDPQANLTMIATAAPVARDSVSMADVLSPRAGEQLVDVTVPGMWKGLDVAPAIEHTLAGVRDELVGISVGREARLRKALAGVEYDLVLIDCPPELGLLTINGLAAATDAVVISHAKLFSAQGTAGILDTINTVREHYNPQLRFAGVIVNAHEAHTITGRERLDELRAAVPVLEPVIPKRAPINDAAEASVGLDQWPGAGDLTDLYDQHLTTITKEKA